MSSSSPPSWERSYPAALKKQEASMLRQRRERAGIQQDAGAVGFGLSGGGIRSATQSLGVFQALARSGLLGRIDYLSTVSGGGYFGACLGRMFTHQSDPDAVAAELAADRPVVDWLRDHGNYLAPNGSGDVLLAIAILLRNWLAVVTVVGLLLLGGFVGIRLVEVAAEVVSCPLPASPLLVLAGAAFGLWCVPLGLAYWMVPFSDVQWHPRPAPSWQLLGRVAAALRRLLELLLVLPLMARLVVLRLRRLPEPEQRNRVSRWVARALTVTALLIGLGLCDELGRRVAASAVTGDWEWLVSALAMLAVAAAAARQLAAIAGPVDAGHRRKRILDSVIVPALAFGTAASWLIVLSCGSFLLVRPDADATALSLGIAFCLCWVLTLSFRNNWSFVNRSSFHTFYRARLTRAYLGASNPDRRGATASVRDSHAGDDISLDEYRPHEHGGPLHVINVTISETLIGQSGLQDVRSRGTGMAVGPAGISVAVRHHALWRAGERTRGLEPLPHDGFHVFSSSQIGPQLGSAGQILPEPLSLGKWTAISGAAASTGMGTRTSLPRSLLAGLFNVRLGYWWNSGVRRPPLGSVHSALALHEFLARFPGVACRQWYLSDGGHFENLAGYELLRRRLPVIVICDFEQDAGYAFQGLATMVRKARLDFGAEICFVGARELDALVGSPVRRWFGKLADLRRGRREVEPVADPVTGEHRHHIAADAARESLATFALARVTYSDPETESWMIYVKPGLVGDEPADVRQYHDAHPDFPHESTADQFFDEAQWESYRRLGEVLGERLWARGEDPAGVSVPRDWVIRGQVVVAP